MELIGESHTYIFGKSQKAGEFPIPHQKVTFCWIASRNQYRAYANMVGADYDVEGYFDNHSSELAYEIFSRYNEL